MVLFCSKPSMLVISLKVKVKVFIITFEVTATGSVTSLIIPLLRALTPLQHRCYCCTVNPPGTLISGPLPLQGPRSPHGTLPHFLQVFAQHPHLSGALTTGPQLPTFLTLPYFSLQHFSLSTVLRNLFIYHVYCLSPPTDIVRKDCNHHSKADKEKEDQAAARNSATYQPG